MGLARLVNLSLLSFLFLSISTYLYYLLFSVIIFPVLLVDVSTPLKSLVVTSGPIRIVSTFSSLERV